MKKIKPQHAPAPHGRGAWTEYGGTTPYYQSAGTLTNHNSGQWNLRTLADVGCVDFKAVRYGVKAIQKTLNKHHGAKLKVNGNYNKETTFAVAQFQSNHSLKEHDGRLGPETAKALFLPIIERLAVKSNVPGKYVGGLVQLESDYDVGAVGWVDKRDGGLAQWNKDASQYTNKEIFDPHFALTKMVERFADAWHNHYAGKTKELQIDCSIAQHNSPVAADLWYRSGKPPTKTIKTYVDLAKKAAG